MWQFILALGFIFLILEMITPVLFFLNFALAAFICAPISVVVNRFYPSYSVSIMVAVFCVLSIVMLYTLRPFLVSKTKNKKQETGIESKYIGKTVFAIEDITKDCGAISLYDERWQARNLNDGVIPKGSKVKIVSYESIIMYVEKVED